MEKLVAAGKISRHHVEPLVQLTQMGYCMHRSWGFGRIKTVDTVFGRLSVDFPAKPGHSMDLAFAAESLKAISGDHILARKAADLEALRQMAALHHLELIKLVLQSYGGKATVEQIQQVLVPDVIADDWKKWWEAAKRELKKDGHFLLPAKKSDPIVYEAKEVSLQERLLGAFRAAKGLKARVAVGADLLKNLDDLDDKVGTATEVINLLNGDIASHQRTQPALALEGVFLRDDLRAASGGTAAAEEINARQIWAQAGAVGAVLEPMSASKHKRALQSFRDANPAGWVEAVLASLNAVSAKLCTEFAQLLIQEGHLTHLKDTLGRLINQHQSSSELLLWLAKERSDAFADVLGPEVFRAMLTAIERDQFNEKKSNRLRDFIVDDQELLLELIESADIEVIKDLTRALQLSPSFDDMDKRSLLARIVKHFPSIQTLISGEHARQDTALVVSWDSLERRKNEYTELVHKKIPANSKEIAVARSYGDLRENHEYKAAKEMQKLLMRRKAELENQLGRARGTDFANPRGDVVSIGTRVRVTDLETQHPEAYQILGAWDFDAEKGVISYLSPMAQALLNRKPGEEVEFEHDGHKKRYRLDAIEPCPAPASAPAPGP
ncbi:MAG: GreA/GreB family elongation factor [Verrucomicrobia bacterium]|nr:GreA/GreB family elongation factor [Verrucomicrobiota bacterium]